MRTIFLRPFGSSLLKKWRVDSFQYLSKKHTWFQSQYFDYFIVFPFVFFDTENWTKDIMYAKQALYHKAVTQPLVT